MLNKIKNFFFAKKQLDEITDKMAKEIAEEIDKTLFTSITYRFVQVKLRTWEQGSPSSDISFRYGDQEHFLSINQLLEETTYINGTEWKLNFTYLPNDAKTIWNGLQSIGAYHSKTVKYE